MLTTFHFAFHRKFIEDLYAQVLGFLSWHEFHAGAGFESWPAPVAGFHRILRVDRNADSWRRQRRYQFTE
jgi:hypothetical protein